MSEERTLSTEALLEALIFASQQPVSPEDLAHALDLDTDAIEQALKALEVQLADRGLRLQRQRGRVQLVSTTEAAPYIEKLLGLEVNLRLSQAALETLAIVAYAQPVTRPQIEAIRGVNSDSVLRTLLAAGLVEETGRAETVGRPILFSTTFEFLQQFGLKSSDDLPALKSPDGDKANQPTPNNTESKS